MPNILIIEDSSFQRSILSRAITAAGHNAILATNGKEGLEIIISDPPDVVISDLLMPEMGGLELLEEIRNRSIAVPTLVLSAEIQDSVREKALSLGVIDFLNKPTTDENLLAAVDKALASSGN